MKKKVNEMARRFTDFRVEELEEWVLQDVLGTGNCVCGTEGDCVCDGSGNGSCDPDDDPDGPILGLPCSGTPCAE